MEFTHPKFTKFKQNNDAKEVRTSVLYHKTGHISRLKGTQIEPHCEKTGLRGFRPGPTKTGLYSQIIWLEA